MHIVRGEFVRFDAHKERALVQAVQPNWPHAFTRLATSASRFLQSFPTNHIHGVYGDYVPELLQVCDLLRVRPVVLEG
jgi:L-fucose isomerase